MTLTPAQHDSAFAAFERAVAAAGSQSELARLIGCTPANIHQLLKARRLLSARFVIPAESATGVSRHDLRPDLYPREDAPALHQSPAQHPAAHPSAPAAQAPLPSAGVDGSLSAPDTDPLEGMAA